MSNPHYCSGFIRSLVNNQAIFFFPFFFPSLRLVLAEGEAGGGVNNLTHGQFFSNCLKTYHRGFFLLLECKIDFLI